MKTAIGYFLACLVALFLIDRIHWDGERVFYLVAVYLILLFIGTMLWSWLDKKAFSRRQILVERIARAIEKININVITNDYGDNNKRH